MVSTATAPARYKRPARLPANCRSSGSSSAPSVQRPLPVPASTRGVSAFVQDRSRDASGGRYRGVAGRPALALFAAVALVAAAPVMAGSTEDNRSAASAEAQALLDATVLPPSNDFSRSSFAAYGLPVNSSPIQYQDQTIR